MEQAINHIVTLVTMECHVCHIVFAIPKDLNDRALKDRNVSWYCPNGHREAYSETENMRLRHKLEQEEATRARAEEASRFWQERTDNALKEVTNQKRQRTRLINRIKNGVCPDCHRSFPNLKEHQASCHGTSEQARAVKESHNPSPPKG